MNFAELEQRLIEIASKSICQKRKVGAIIVSRICELGQEPEYEELVIGYNHNTLGRHTHQCEDSNGKTLDDVVHAEVDCLNDYALVVDARNPCMYITHEPCTSCQAALAARSMPYIVLKHTEEQKKAMQLSTSARPLVIPEEPSKLTNTLAERGSTYGTFQGNARCTQSIMHVLTETAAAAQRELEDWELEAFHMIAHKLSRVANGQKKKKDNWHDIAGYAKLAEDLTVDG